MYLIWVAEALRPRLALQCWMESMGSRSTRLQRSDKPSTPVLPAMFGRYEAMVGRELSQAVPLLPLAELSNVMRYHLGWVDRHGQPAASPASQGKALRPTLCVFACQALDGDSALALPAAAALELIHNFSLIHDDIQDQGYERRHQPTVWALWGAPRALVAGDAMQSVGDLSALNCAGVGVPPAVALKVSGILTESYLEMIEGQCRDLVFETKTTITVDQYLEMIALKTGALIRSAVEIGSLLATGDSATTAAFANFGSYLGRAFQIRDDFLGIWGDEKATGKTADGDIRQRKKSFPVVYALENSLGTARRELSRIYGTDDLGYNQRWPSNQDELEESDIVRVREVLDQVGAAGQCQQLTERSASQALDALIGVELAPWARTEMEELVHFLSRREF